MKWITDHLTPANVVILILAAEAAFRLLKQWAPKTATTVDDDVVAGVERTKSWALSMAPAFWAIAEVAARGGLIPKAEKAAKFLVDLKSAYYKEHGTELPDTAVVAAQSLVAGLSAADKLGKPMASVTPALDPINGPQCR